MAQLKFLQERITVRNIFSQQKPLSLDELNKNVAEIEAAFTREMYTHLQLKKALKYFNFARSEAISESDLKIRQDYFDSLKHLVKSFQSKKQSFQIKEEKIAEKKEKFQERIHFMERENKSLILEIQRLREKQSLRDLYQRKSLDVMWRMEEVEWENRVRKDKFCHQKVAILQKQETRSWRVLEALFLEIF